MRPFLSEIKFVRHHHENELFSMISNNYRCSLCFNFRSYDGKEMILILNKKETKCSIDYPVVAMLQSQTTWSSVNWIDSRDTLAPQCTDTGSPIATGRFVPNKRSTTTPLGTKGRGKSTLLAKTGTWRKMCSALVEYTRNTKVNEHPRASEVMLSGLTFNGWLLVQDCNTHCHEWSCFRLIHIS